VLRWLAHRLFFMGMTSGWSMLGAGTVAGLGIGVFCTVQVERNAKSLDVWFSAAESACRAMLGVGIACVLTVIAAILVWVWSRGWPRPVAPPESSGSSLDDGSDQPSGLVVVLGLALALLPLGILLGAGPAFLFAIKNRALMNPSLEGIFLMMPFFELAMAAGWLVAGIGLALAFGARDRLFPRAFFLMLTIQLGLLVASHQALAVTRSAIEPFAAEIPVAQDHVAAVEAAARNLAGVFAAYAVLLPVVLLSGAVQKRFSEKPRLRFADVPVPAVRPAPAAAGPATKPPRGGSLSSSRYFIQATYIGGPFGGLLQIRDLDRNRGLVAWMAPLQLRRVVQVFADRERKTEILRIEAKQVLSLAGRYDVFDSTTQEKVGMVKKHFPTDWEIHDGLDQPIGAVTRDGGFIGQATYRASIGPHEVGVLQWSNVLKPGVEVDYSADVDQLLDRRLGLALGLLVFIHLSTPGPG
jgi:hypothetical protein